ncbi:hypothetical protein BN8_02277 [Fibrisoma limi BUZ 3]|uniref:Uncharacterized protein n=1 Tax=Fibrisoma limi BUZ 3 TaxID=1185876 RepID=I2GH26_9BACT|nr:hypothetical protein BN8_02277 [Fibrisoma limi BUZ 3]
MIIWVMCSTGAYVSSGNHYGWEGNFSGSDKLDYQDLVRPGNFVRS